MGAKYALGVEDEGKSILLLTLHMLVTLFINLGEIPLSSTSDYN